MDLYALHTEKHEKGNMNGYALQAKNNNREILKRHCVLPKEHLSTYKRIHFIRQKGTYHTAKGYLSEGKRMPFKIQKGTYHAAKRHILKRKKDILKA